MSQLQTGYCLSKAKLLHLNHFSNFIGMKSNTVIEHPPRTAMEVFKILPEGTLAEVIDNQIYMATSPFYKHQKLIKTLSRKLLELVEDKEVGEICISPLDVFLDEKSNAVQPDIIIVLEANKNIIDPDGHIHGAPDVLVEILSTGNEYHDIVRKKNLYEKFGVKEYWVIDPTTKVSQVFQWSSEGYNLVSEQTAKINSPLLKINFGF
jgi:Uma2 family endonuclease